LNVRVNPDSLLEHVLSVRQVLYLVILQATQKPIENVKVVWQTEQTLDMLHIWQFEVAQGIQYGNKEIKLKVDAHLLH